MLFLLVILTAAYKNKYILLLLCVFGITVFL